MSKMQEKLDIKTLLTVAGMVFSGLSSYYAMSTRVAVLENNVEHQKNLVSEQGHIIKENTKVMNELKLVLREITIKLSLEEEG